MCSPNFTENDLRIGKEIGMQSGFLSKEGGRRYFILASDKNKKDQKSLRSKLLPETGRSQATNLETQN